MSGLGGTLVGTCNQGQRWRLKLMRRRHQEPKPYQDEFGRWVVRYREYVIVNGIEKGINRKRILGVMGKREALKLAEELVRPLNKDDYRPLQMGTFQEFAQRWQETVMIHHEPSTQASERAHLKNHLLPAFGRLEPKQLTAEILQQWISKQTLATKSVRNVLATLSTMLSTAKKWQYIERNPIEDLVLPKKQKPKTYAFTIEETLAIIDKAQEPWKTLIRIVAESGVRSGEVAGLRIEDFDPVNLTIGVRQSVWGRKIKEPKTANSIRMEPISYDLAQAILKHIERTPANSYGLIFAGKTGRPLEMIHFLNRVFRPILAELGIRAKLDSMGIQRCGLHGLRRMNATQMDVQKVPMATRQERLGHAHPSTTLYHYTKPISDESRKFAERMGAILSPDTKGAIQ